LRIIGGKLKGKKLARIRGTKIRPTADRLREAIFNILADRVKDAFVLDLFAGSGACGIEALSRGAQFAVFVDNSKESITTIKNNVRSCGYEQCSETIRWDILKNLNCIGAYDRGFDLVFLDPPYNTNCITPTLIKLHRKNTLVRGGCIVIEHSYHEGVPSDIGDFRAMDGRRYGQALVTFLSCGP
jgi:16S rRNA (guanine966-N2)-methyltransferase